MAADLKKVYGAATAAEAEQALEIRKWKEALNHFAILFEGRLPK